MKKLTPKKNPLVSVNIRTFNSERYLGATLKSVKNQSYKKIEIIASDGFSIDGTLSILKQYKSKIGFAEKLGDARQQNLEKSRGEYVMSVDSDQVLSPKLIEACVKKMIKEDLDALTISEKSMVSNKSTFLQKLIAYDKWVIDQNRDDDVVFGTACPRFFKRNFLKKIKWPPELSIFDDTILYSEVLAKGAKTGYLTTPSIYHNEVAAWGIVFKKYFRFGKGYFKSLEQKPLTIGVHSIPRRSYFSKVAFSKPKYFFGLFILYAVKSSAAFCGAILGIVGNAFSKTPS